MRVLKRWAKLFSAALIFAFLFAFVVAAATGDTIVYITNTGEKYHSYGCQYLRKSCIEITLSSAVSSGYGRCSKCRPPILEESASPSSGDWMEQARENAKEQDQEAVEPKQKVTYGSSGVSETEMKKAVEEAREEERAEKDEAVKDAVAKAELDAEIYLNQVVEDLQRDNIENIVACIAGTVILFAIVWLVTKRKLQDKDIEIMQLKREIKEIKEKQEAIQWFDGKSARELANVPDGVMFSGDHWPISINGNNLLVCPNSGRAKYHRQTCRYAAGIRPVSVYSLDSSFEPCGICKPIKYAGKPQWLTDYRKYIDQKRKYQIEDPDLPDNY